jgi:O-antigen/teichoic acid export membrane protein
MPNVRWFRRPLPTALLFGGGYAGMAVVLQIGSPVAIVLSSLLFAGLGWLMASRQMRGKPPVSIGASVALGVGALTLYTAVLILTEPPPRSDWIFVAIAFAFPIALLVMAYREWRARSSRGEPDEHSASPGQEAR